MTYAKVWADYPDDYLEVSDKLAAREQFLMSFTPTGSVEQDMRTFLHGVGRADLVTATQSVKRGMFHHLARSLRDQLQTELDQLSASRSDDAPLQRRYHEDLLALESGVLTSILDADHENRSAGD